MKHVQCCSPLNRLVQFLRMLNTTETLTWLARTLPRTDVERGLARLSPDALVALADAFAGGAAPPAPGKAVRAC